MIPEVRRARETLESINYRGCCSLTNIFNIARGRKTRETFHEIRDS